MMLETTSAVSSVGIETACGAGASGGRSSRTSPSSLGSSLVATDEQPDFECDVCVDEDDAAECEDGWLVRLENEPVLGRLGCSWVNVESSLRLEPGTGDDERDAGGDGGRLGIIVSLKSVKACAVEETVSRAYWSR